MPLVIEDGTGIAGANSYVTLAEYRAYGEARGIVVSADDDVATQQLIKGVDWLEAQSARYKGQKTYATQDLQFPRDGVDVYGTFIGNNVIPKNVKAAQMQLGIEISQGVDLFPTRTGAFLKRKKIGPIEREWSETIGDRGPLMPAVEALLSPLLLTNGGFGLRTVRV